MDQQLLGKTDIVGPLFRANRLIAFYSVVGMYGDK